MSGFWNESLSCPDFMSRILYIYTQVSGGADETLRLWKCFQPDPSKKKQEIQAKSGNSKLISRAGIRWIDFGMNICIFVALKFNFHLFLFFLSISPPASFKLSNASPQMIKIQRIFHYQLRLFEVFGDGSHFLIHVDYLKIN